MNEFTSVITTFNDSQYLQTSLDSLLSQTLKPAKIIVVDDKSDEENKIRIDKILGKVQSNIPLELIRNSINLGLPGARNEAIKVCKTAYCSFLDSDDWYYKDKLAQSFIPLERYPEVGIVYSDFDILDETTKIVRREYKFSYDIRLALQTCIVSTNTVFRMSIFEKCGMYDPNWRTTEDLELQMRVFPYFMAYHIPLSLFMYRLHPKQLTQVYRDKIIAETQKLLKRGLVTRESI